MTQPDPRKFVAEALADRFNSNAPESKRLESGMFVTVTAHDGYPAMRGVWPTEVAEVAVAALRDAGWEDREQVALRKHERDLLLVELNRRPAPDEIDTLFRQRDEAIEERDRLRRDRHVLLSNLQTWRADIGDVDLRDLDPGDRTLVELVDAYEAKGDAL